MNSHNPKEKLKQELCRQLSLKNAILFSSCRNAIYLLLKNLKFQPSDEIIIQSFICDSLVQAIEKAGAKVVFVDVDSQTLNLTASTVDKAITPHTKAIIFVHTYGNPTGIKEISTLCRQHNLILIEDIAHAFGAKYNGKMAGTFGDYAIYSFTKQMVNLGGGAIITNHDLSFLDSSSNKNKSKNHAPLLGYIKRFLSSLYETRAFFLSKILIDLARRKKKLKMTNCLDQHHNCTPLEARIALWQLPTLTKKIDQRKINFHTLKSKVPSQKIDASAEPSYNYLTIFFSDKIQRDRAVKENSLFLPPWSGSSVSSHLVFIPNNPAFSKKKLFSFIATFNKVYKP